MYWLYGGILIYKNISQKQLIGTEYTPEEEISDEQLRKTIVTLYFKNKENGTIMPEARQIDVSILAKDPYQYLIKELINGPKNEKMEKVIPEGTQLYSVELKGDVLWIDFSKEFIENAKEGKEEEEKIMFTISNTLTELTEINAIRILINGEEGKGFRDNQIQFDKNFERKN